MSESNFIRKYWKQVDLHSHTLHGIDCKGKSITSNYSHRIFKDALIEFKTQLHAVTNHNTFVLEDHIKQAIICDTIDVNYIPGVEIDIKLKKKARVFQCIFLLGPKNDVVEFEKRLTNNTNEKRKSKNVTYDENEISEIFLGMHFIYVVHGVKKKGLAESESTIEEDSENVDWVCSAIKNALAEPILFENSNPNNLYALVNRFKTFTDREDIIELAKRQVTSSDYCFDNNYQRYNNWLSREKFAICSDPTYEGLEVAIRQYESRFRQVSEIVKPVAFIEKIIFENRDDKKFNISGSIECSPYFNIIIGNSGSGKTLLLNEIYRSINNINLDASGKSDTVKSRNEKNQSVYEKYIGKDKYIVTSKLYQERKAEVVEIGKIYKEIISASDPEHILELFEISISPDINLLLSDYKNNVLIFEKCLKNLKIYNSNGDYALNSITSNMQFILNNPIQKSSFGLKRNTFDDSSLRKNYSSLELINSLKKRKKDIEGWINDVKRIIPPAKYETISKLNNLVQETIKAIDEEENVIKRNINTQLIEQKLAAHYNDAVYLITKILGSKQAEVDKANSTITEQENIFRNYIIDALKEEYRMDSINLIYPFNSLTDAFNNQKSNNYFKLTADYSDHDKSISKENIGDNKLIRCNNVLTSLKKAIKNRKYSLINDDDVKEFIKDISSLKVDFSSILSDEIQYTIQIRDGDLWKNISEINPGNLAKRYMEYYFEKTLDEKRPNVVFIDQPENDVDKTFISTILAKFITEHKKSVQFFITSHEPILGVNADSNLIIEAYRNEKSAICYRAKKIESASLNNNDESGLTIVARILDGGKQNVIERNQIYGGSIDD